jgi:hypothetical protein
MTRAAFLIILAVSAAVAAQEPLPLPLPLPADAGKKDEPKKKDEKDKKGAPAMQVSPLTLPGTQAKKDEKKPAAPPPLPLPGLDAAPSAPAKSAETKALPPLPLPAPVADKAAPPAVEKAAAPKAVPASDKPAVKTLTASGEKASAAPAAAPLASSMTQFGETRLRPDLAASLWNLRGFAGGERSTEQSYTDPVSHSRLGVEGTRWFSGTWVARGEVDWRNSRQPYVPVHSAGTAGRTVFVDENRFDVLATVGYDFGPRLLRSGRLELTPMLGVHYVGIRNDAFPSDLIGPEIGGRVRFALSNAVIAHATLGYAYNLAVASKQNSALKAPKGDFSARAGLALPLSGGYALELDYQGDVLGFENTYRVAHGAALGFGSSF